jgi:hypothetical protein
MIIKTTPCYLLFAFMILDGCQTIQEKPVTATVPIITVSTESASVPSSAPHFRPVCGPPVGGHFANEDSFGDGYVSRVSIQDVINEDQQDIVFILVNQWLGHYKTQSQSISAAIKDYSIDKINLGDPFCNPFFQILASVRFSIIPSRTPNDYASFPGDTISPNDVWWHLVAPFGVFKDGNDYRLRLVFGWGT